MAYHLVEEVPRPVAKLVADVGDALGADMVKQGVPLLTTAVSAWGRVRPSLQEALRLDMEIQTQFPIIMATKDAFQRLEAHISSEAWDTVKKMISAQGIKGIGAKVKELFPMIPLPGCFTQILTTCKTCENLDPESLKVKLDGSDLTALQKHLHLYMKIKAVDVTFLKDTMSETSEKVAAFTKMYEGAFKTWFKTSVKEVSKAKEALEPYRPVG